MKRLYFVLSIMILGINTHAQERLLPINVNFDVQGYDMTLQKMFKLPSRAEWCVISIPASSCEYSLFYDKENCELISLESSESVFAANSKQLMASFDNQINRLSDTVTHANVNLSMDFSPSIDSSIKIERNSVKIDNELALSIGKLFLYAARTASFSPINQGYIPDNYEYPFTKIKVYAGWAVSGYFCGEFYIPENGPRDSSNCSKLYETVENIHQSIKSGDSLNIKDNKGVIDGLTQRFKALMY